MNANGNANEQMRKHSASFSHVGIVGIQSLHFIGEMNKVFVRYHDKRLILGAYYFANDMLK